MKVLNYAEVLKLSKELSQDLVDKKQLRNHCRIHELNYLNVVSFLRGNRKAKQPKLICDFLKSVGYATATDKIIEYNFIVDTKNESEYLYITELIKESENEQDH